MKQSITNLIKRALQLNDAEMLAFILTLCDELVRRSSGKITFADILQDLICIHEMKKEDED